jgi:hypothetical protein
MKKLFIYFLLKSDLTYYNLLERKIIKINILATDPKTKADSILLPVSLFLLLPQISQFIVPNQILTKSIHEQAQN